MLRYIYITITLMLCYVSNLVAQDVDYDYRIYKYYEEPQDMELWLRGVAQDTVSKEVDMLRFTQPASSARYALTSLGYMSRGVGRTEESYSIGMLGVEYGTARILGSLGAQHTTLDGMAAAPLSGAITEAHIYDAAPRWDGHYMRGVLSTKDYNIGISHRATYRLPQNGVLLDDGWRLSHYTRLRTGRDVSVEGLFSSSAEVAFGAAYDDRRHSLEVVAMLPWSERGLRESSTAEAFSLTDNRLYNPCWGVQDGRVRNARVAMSLHPEALLSWRYRLTALTTLEIGADVGFRRSGTTALAWFDAPTPMPDNYRYMPSYFTDDVECRAVTDAWAYNDLRYTQIDWDDLYHTNRIQSDGHARYAVEERRHNLLHGALIVGFNSRIGDVELRYGMAMSHVTDRAFKVMDDLLGADHIVDYDYYLRDDATYSNAMQNNLLEPNREVHCGDRYGYDYALIRSEVGLYGMLLWRGDAMTLNVGAEFAAQYTWRRGYYEKELFPGAGSLGRSQRIAKSPYRLSAAWHYGEGQHLVGIAAMLRGDSPKAEDMFLQTQYNNRTSGQTGLSTTAAAEVTHRFDGERIATTATLYVVSYNNYTDVLHYYDDLAGLYTDTVVSNIDRLHCGVELTATVTWLRSLSSTLMLNVGRYSYVGDALVETYADSSNDSVAVSRASMTGCSVGAPQLTAYADIAYAVLGWQLRLSAQCRALAHVSPSFVRRTERVVGYAPSTEEAEALRHQQRLDDGITLNIHVAKRIRLKGGMGLRLQLAANNILGSGVIYSGYEQNRVLKRVVQGRTHVEPFANKMRYGAMRSVELSASLWF